MSIRKHLEHQLRQLIEATPNAMAVIGSSGLVEMVNARFQQIFGYYGDEFLGRPAEHLIPERFRHNLDPMRDSCFSNLHSGPGMTRRKLAAVRKDGSEFPVEICLYPIETEAGPMLLSAIVDLSYYHREEERIHAALRGKEVMLGEIHHRIKNNLQVVCSLLDLKSRAISDPAALSILRDSRNRILSMALIHQTLYKPMDFTHVDFALFMDELLPNVIESFDIDTTRFRIFCDVEPIRLPVDAAIPCGLVLNELVSNSLKHAFADRDQGEIRISLARQASGEHLLRVSDNGIGLPDRAVMNAGDGLGMKLIGLLTKQINGTISIQRSDPTLFSIQFPA